MPPRCLPRPPMFNLSLQTLPGFTSGPVSFCDRLVARELRRGPWTQNVGFSKDLSPFLCLLRHAPSQFVVTGFKSKPDLVMENTNALATLATLATLDKDDSGCDKSCRNSERKGITSFGSNELMNSMLSPSKGQRSDVEHFAF